jgi:hypothetical protein
MGKSVTVNTGYENIPLAQGVYNDGDVVVISDAEYDILVEHFGSLENLEVVLTIGANVADPAIPDILSFTVDTLVADVATLQDDVGDLQTADTAMDVRVDALEANDTVQDAAIADHEGRITALEP